MEQPMRAVRFHRHGGPDVLQVDQVAVPEPAAGQVLIEVEAIGANAIDTVLRVGGTPWDRPLPGTLTGDVVGRIAKLGPDTPPGLAVGQRVAALSEDAFVDFALADAGCLLNGIPGWVDTPIWQDVAGDATADTLAAMAARLPVGRIGRTKDITDAIIALLRNGFITGTVLHADGGHRLV
jgi:NADPH2:quinone reductase